MSIQVNGRNYSFSEAFQITRDYHVSQKDSFSGIRSFFNVIAGSLGFKGESLKKAINAKSNAKAQDLGGRNANSNIPPEYKLLNLAPGATLKDLKAAYKRETMKYHPDKFNVNQGTEGYACKTKDEATAHFQDINNAYHKLLETIKE